VNTIAHSQPHDDFDSLRGISLELDRFFDEERRRERILEMQERIRPGRTKPIAVRLDQFTVNRLKSLAALHNIGYQTLLKEFVVERLYEEERRAGIIRDPAPHQRSASDHTPPQRSASEPAPPTRSASEPGPPKRSGAV
jgi:hypothetical protein